MDGGGVYCAYLPKKLLRVLAAGREQKAKRRQLYYISVFNVEIQIGFCSFEFAQHEGDAVKSKQMYVAVCL